MKILVADDNPFYLCALAATLADWGYEVVTATSGSAAWAILREDNAPKLAILDWVMPGMDGPEVCSRVRALSWPEPTYLIVLTSKEGKGNIVTALSSGPDDYVTKPFDREELQARVRVGARIVGLQTSQTALFVLARAVEAKSPFTKGHSDRVTAFALALAEAVGVSAAERELLERGGILHDIGKISIPDAILNKPGPLTPEERVVINQHPAQGVNIIAPLESLRDMVPLIRWHHERLDGRGYPDGLKADQIPYLVRILSVADVYDALQSERPSCAAVPHARCLEILRADAAGGGLDPELVRLFCCTFPTSAPPAVVTETQRETAPVQASAG
jgi:putative two-component system response regulator